jgi:hypothetical protein
VVAQNARRPLSSAFGEGCRVPSLLGSPGLHPVAAPSQHRKAGTAGHASASTAFRAVDVSAFFNLRDRYKKFAKYWGESRERIPNETLRSKITFHLWRRPSAVPRRVSLEPVYATLLVFLDGSRLIDSSTNSDSRSSFRRGRRVAAHDASAAARSVFVRATSAARSCQISASSTLP